ncbi:MAG: hypothetical protein ACU0C9_14045 [Paracoccaceae bacterium]
MAEPETPKPIDLGIFARRDGASQIAMTEAVAGGLSVLWLLAVTLFFVFAGGQTEDGTPRVDTLRFVMTIIAVFMPVALIWVAATTARSNRIMREESERLQSAINAMRHSYIQQQQSGVSGIKPAVEQKLDEIAAAQRKTETTLSKFTSIRPRAEWEAARQKSALSPQYTPTPQTQGSLELGTSAESIAPPLSLEDFIRALHFPETADDKEGFRALRRALQDRKISQLIQAAQDVLTLLSQDGIYMDDLTPDRARPEIWRRFAQGERGKSIAVIGGIRDRSSLALTAGRMRQDPIFRDSVHHFIRKFDHTFTEFEKTATDMDIADLSDTRSARAFMLLGRATGTFD